MTTVCFHKYSEVEGGDLKTEIIRSTLDIEGWALDIIEPLVSLSKWFCSQTHFIQPCSSSYEPLQVHITVTF